MKLNQRFSLEIVESRFQICTVLKEYYQGNLLENQKNLEKAKKILSKQNEYLQNVYYQQGLALIEQVDPGAIYDFNKLFIGPAKLLAPPYESAYRNPEGLLMQQETLNVRNFYNLVGLTIDKKNIEPDDFIVIELEFICFLLSNIAKSLTNDNLSSYEYFSEKYKEFLERFLLQWIFQHCKDIIIHCHTSLCKGMALITQGFFETENFHLINKEGNLWVEN